MGFFDGLAKFGSQLWGGFKDGLGFFTGLGNKIRDGIGWVYDKVKRVPIVGDLVDSAIGAPIYKGISIKDIANGANAGLNTANAIKEGIDMIGGLPRKKVVGFDESSVRRPINLMPVGT